MNVDQASKIILAPYITEKTFSMIDRENKLVFIAHNDADKRSIKEAIKILYDIEVDEVNTMRSINGKKVFLKMKEPGAARDLAVKMGLV